jgi:tRNA wybutosine-synthesizing protein 2
LSRASAPSANLAIIAGKAEADAVLGRTIREGILDKRRKVLSRGDRVEIPVLARLDGYKFAAQEKIELYRSAPRLEELLAEEMSSREQSLLPKGWYILGEVIVVKIHPDLEGFKHTIGRALLEIYPRCRAVVRDFGIDGPLREPVRELIAGERSETVHRENGVRFRLDALRIMFSQGNLRERMRMSLLGQGETVVDMFAGIGYFSIPMAVHSRPQRVLAIELNPVAHKYLVENARLNGVEDIVQPRLGDCSKETPSGDADRVIMGLVQVTDKYLQQGIGALRAGGILHYHQTIPSRLYPQAAIQEVVAAAGSMDRRAEIIRCAKVKKFSPGVVHAVVDARIDDDY